jgi:excinuclease ABC subunit A
MELEESKNIIVKGAREHNLKNINLQIPKNQLVLFTGVSGSGKSSLAFDTLCSEGQRRYVESLSSYIRQFLHAKKRPDVDAIKGLSPTIAVDQHGLSHNPRSTVGTVTEIYDYFRVLYARIGKPHCPECGQPIGQLTNEDITEKVMDKIKTSLKAKGKARFYILSPVVRNKTGDFSKLLDNLLKKGFEKVRIDGWIYDLDEDVVLIKTNPHNIEVVVDTISIVKKIKDKQTLRTRIKESVQLALQLSDGLIILSEVLDEGFSFPEKPKEFTDKNFSQRFNCPDCDLSFPQLEPKLFSFNSPEGACSECNGLGVKLSIDRNKVSGRKADKMEQRYYSTSSDTIREEIEKYMLKKKCPVCSGARLNKAALAVTIDGLSIADLTAFALTDLKDWVEELPDHLVSNRDKQIAGPVIEEVLNRISFLLSVGVGYLNLGRTAASLSAGEAQRIRLASQLGTGLTGVLYILDEPTVGLHPRDNERLIDTLFQLRDLGNTVVVVEHEPDMVRAADWIIDFGPRAGRDGGKIVAEGEPKDIYEDKKSLTGKYLSGEKQVSVKKLQNNATGSLHLEGCQEHNLKNLDVTIPLNKFTCITGVSGSGKSTLMTDTLYPAVKKRLSPRFQGRVGEHQSLKGTDQLKKVLLVDQSPIGQTRRSNPATYTSALTGIRKLFAKTELAKVRGFSKSHFSFNNKAGRCPACRGKGKNKIPMQFLPDIWVECEECGGRRYKREVLEVKYKGKSIDEVLNMTVVEGLDFFKAIPNVSRKLNTLDKVGLGYLALEQPSPTLSGGEAQRLKIARELVKRGGNTLYLLDEPTTGLHYHDLQKLINVLMELVEKGNTVVVIEHNLSLIKHAQHIIDLGPEGGANGGEIIASGKPNAIAADKESLTGQFLKEVL